MATTVYSVEEIQLYDGTVVALKPLPIKYLKQFMQKFTNDEENAKVTDEASGLDRIVDLAGFCLNSLSKEKPRDDFDEVLDLETAYRIIEVCGGVKLNDPNLVKAAAEAAAAQVGRN